MSVELLHRARAYTDTVLGTLTAEDLHRPTPCDEWDVARVVLHLADVADGLVGLVETGELALPEPPRTADPDPVSVVQAALTRLAAALTSTLTSTLATTSDADRAHAAARAGAIELTVHGWDLGMARDPEHVTPADLADDVRALAAELLSDDARAPRFGAALAVPATAPPSDRLAGFAGRRT